MEIKYSKCYGVALTLPCGGLMFLHYFDTDIERCLEVRKTLEEHPEIQQYCLNHTNDQDVLQFLDLVGTFILGEKPIESEIDEYKDIINVQ